MGPFKDEMCCEQAEDDEIDAVQYETVKYDTFIKNTDMGVFSSLLMVLPATL